MNDPVYCPVCGNNKFSFSKILWPALINDWQLSPIEVGYINRQQGFTCLSCLNNFRAMALAAAIASAYNISGVLTEFVESDFAKKLRVLEVNEAGRLSSILKKMPNHQLIHYPEYDMTNLSFGSGTFDMVLHSDTLEHVANPERALSECRRVLRDDGKCIFTVPIIVNRLTRSRVGLEPSYHGQSGIFADDQIVCTEFGADIWRTVLEAGFSSCDFFSLEYPAALAMIARK